MRTKLNKASYNKQGSTIFAIIFALIAILGIMSILTPPSVPEPEEPSQIINTRSNYSGYLSRVVIVTLTMIVILVVGLKMYQKNNKRGGKNSLGINILGRHYINNKQYLLKVLVEDKYLLLGVSESTINFITELEDSTDMGSSSDTSFGSIIDLETKEETKV
ncbi:MAG: flagellar biosynthetic protein FliO [Candidatus Marinimicrobia bacterium]|nr:flagellar biosynthetic protein FliO [Candidatus Neomarinimicrobiota bacterium]